MKDTNFHESNDEKELHYETVKNYFKKSAEKKSRFYDLKSEQKLEQELKKRNMWKVYASTLDEILQSDSEISSVIDVACGMGNFIMELVKRNQFKKIIGIDFLKETFDIARKTGNMFGNIYFLQGNLLNLPFNNRSFDLTVCLNTLHHIHKNDFFIAINELSRITEKYLMVEIRNKNCILVPLIKKVVLKRFFRDLPFYSSSISELNDLMKKNGFNNKIIRGNRSLIMTCWRLVIVYERI